MGGERGDTPRVVAGRIVPTICDTRRFGDVNRIDARLRSNGFLERRLEMLGGCDWVDLGLE